MACLCLVLGLAWPSMVLADGFFGYRSLDIEGWDVRLERELDRRNFIVAKAVEMEVARQLDAIERQVPPWHLPSMQAVSLWISHSNAPGLSYHDSAHYLSDQGRDPRMLGGIEIGDARDFLAMSETQSWVLLHEFAHALHHKNHAWRFAPIDRAWLNARRGDLYRDVAHRHPGPERDAYALTNPREYLAELSQAFFGDNAMFPFNRRQLYDYDPNGYQAVFAFWCDRPSGWTGKAVSACDGPIDQPDAPE